MAFYADLHVHSRYSRATSKDADLEHLALWGQRKGLSVVGTGDFTHPAWLEEIRQKLVPAEPGLYRLEPEIEERVARRVPRACRSPVRFALEVEISTIYKKGERTRKVHHLVYCARLETVDELRRRLDRIGNLDSDGRPILGLDSRDLLEIVLESGEDAYLIPAHIWTPWFSALGSKSGFDSIRACYGDLADHVFAAETGLSSDPPMNWRVSDLDRYRLVSNSDAHSPPKLAREACVFDAELDYFRMREALETGQGYVGTVEFFPEEGKYHLDGHRKCGVRLEPRETRQRGGECPECGKPVTVGVMHRVEELADRPPGARPEGREPFWSLVPLPEILGEVRDVGAGTKTVEREFASLLDRLGPELAILRDLPLEEVEAAADPRVAEAVRRLRDGDVRRDPGFDGEYGTIHLFDPEELEAQPAMVSLLQMEDGGEASSEDDRGSRDSEGEEAETETEEEEGRGASGRSPREGPAEDISAETAGAANSPGSGDSEAPGDAGESPGGDPLDALDPDQRRAAEVTGGPLLIVAGPGTGKTRTLTHRIAHLVETGEADPEACLAVTFTRRAAAEMRDRLERLVPEAAGRILVTTFHGLGLRILRERPEAVAGTGGSARVAGPREQRRVARQVLGLDSEEEARSALREISERRREAAGGREVSAGGRDSDGGDGAPGERAARYVEALRERGLVDFDDLLILPVRALEADEAWRRELADRWRWISVDEYQDVDPVQYRLVRLLAPAGSDVCAIGDPDQSIYGFRGAEVGFFLRFREDYPEARVVELSRNYRSSRAIVDAALGAVGPESLVDERRLEPAPGEGPEEVVLREAPTGRAEAEFVVHTIERLVGGTSYFSLDSGRVAGTEAGHDLSFSDFAVLYRTKRQAEPLAEALDRSGIPYQRRSHEPLAERPAVDRLVRALRELRDGPAQVGESGTRPGASGGARAGAAEDDATVEAWLDRALDRALDRERGGQLELLGSPGDGGDASTGSPDGTDDADPDGEEPVSPAALRDARRMLSPLAGRHGRDVEDFLAALSLGAEVDAWDPRADRVSLLTLHAAKGLEFPVVFVVGCEDGLLPLRWGGQGGDETDAGADRDRAAETAEERRLFFVGMTRAERRLYLTRARRRQMEGVPPEREPSPFLEDIPPELLDRREHEPPGSGGDDTDGAAAGAAEAADGSQLDLLG